MLDRSKPPVFNKSFSFDLIDPEHVRLESGADIWYIKGGDQNVIKIEVVFSAGKWYEPLLGVSYFTANLLNKSTAGKNSFEIASAFDELGAHLEVQPGNDHVTISLYSLTKKLAPALALLREILLTATFDERELQQLKSIYLQNLKVSKEKTSVLASNAFREIIFGKDHPYGAEVDETATAQITQQQLIDFHNTFFKSYTIFISGKIDASAKQLITETFGTFLHQPAITQEIEEQNILPAHLHLEKEGSVQSSLRIGKKTIQRTATDYPALLLLTHILGGYFGSRLMKNIREEKGLTYGIHSTLRHLKHDSFIIIGTDVNKENKQIAFREIEQEIQKLSEKPIGPDELDIARNHFIGSLQTELSTAFAHAEKIRNVVLFDLPKDFYPEIINKINQLTPEDLQDTAQKHFQVDSFFEVSVG